MCVKARAYKWWTVLKGKWTGHSFIEEESKGYVSKARISFERLGRSPGMFGEGEDGSWKIYSY